MGASQVLSPQAAPVHEVRLKREFTNLPESLIEAARVTDRTPFDPKKHLNFKPPGKILTLEELGKGGVGISPNAVSEPFALFTEEAIKQMRAEIFSKPVLDKFHCQTAATSGQVRGHCPQDAPFIYNAWNSPEVLEIISKVAGVDLVPAIDYDIGHVNISVNSDGTENDCVAPGEQTVNTDGYCESAFGWHTDSYPFVVVTMLSDCTGMVGGETSIRTGSGDIMKARGPALGTAVVMQGRYVEHQATAALEGRERISMVTSFRPKSPLIKDDTILRGVRNISHLPTLYTQYTEYRLENLEERVRDELRKLRKRKAAKADFDTVGVRNWLLEQRAFIDAMLGELRAD